VAHSETSNRQSPLITAGIVLGIGLGGFFDGIAWDLGFLALGAFLVAIGWIMIQQNKQESIVKRQ